MININSLENVTGGKIAQNPNGSCETVDKYFVIDDNSNTVIAQVGGYRHARKIAESLGQSVEMTSIEQ